MVWWRTLRAVVARLFLPGSMLFASLQGPVSPEYPVLNSMSAMARFPWVWTCVQTLSRDQAGRPLVAYKKGKRRQKPIEVDDPALDLLENPNAATTAYLFRKQLWADFELVGNAYIWRPMDASGVVVAIYRLHPRAVRPIPGPMGMPAGYEWVDTNSERRVLPPHEVLHVRDISWQDSAVEIVGESAVRCLHDDLVADLGVRQQSAQAASLGRPDILFSSKAQLGDAGANSLIERWTKAMTTRARAFVVGGEVTATPLSWTPEELGQIERSDQVRDIILAVFGVPPSRAGVPGANYATSRQEEKGYWERQRARARVFDDAFSLLAAPGVHIAHDYSDIEALQAGYSERIAQAQALIAMGWPPEAALEYFGFVGLPPRPADADEDSGADDPALDDTGDPEPNEPADRALPAVTAALLLHMQCSRAVYAELDEGVDTSLILRWQTERLFSALADAGVEPVTARWWAEELCGIADEAVRMGLDPFTEARVTSAAQRICARRAA